MKNSEDSAISSESPVLIISDITTEIAICHSYFKALKKKDPTMKFAKPALTATRINLAACGVPLRSHGLDVLPIPDSFWPVPTEVSDRAVCETQPHIQQLIPYVTLINEHNQLFVYGRGEKGGEKRLVGKLSLGLGGHVDTECGGDLKEHLALEALRELKEEASLTLSKEDILFQALLSDQMPDGNAVSAGSVHLGIWCVAFVTSSDIGKLEAGIINDGDWLSLDVAAGMFDSFETWSQMIIRELQDFGDSRNLLV